MISYILLAARDFCLVRFAKQNVDGSFAVCLDSVSHTDCPSVPGIVRAELHAVYLVSPPRNAEMEVDGSIIYMESMLTFIAQMDPRGWIWQSFGYQDAMLQQFLLHVIDLRDFIDEERFVQVALDNSSALSDRSQSENNTKSDISIANSPPPTLSRTMWSEPDASTFRLRSKTYLQDNFKCNSAPALFKLVAIDVFEVRNTFTLWKQLNYICRCQRIFKTLPCIPKIEYFRLFNARKIYGYLL